MSKFFVILIAITLMLGCSSADNFSKVTVKVSSKNLYVYFYNSIDYLPLNQICIVSVDVDVLHKYVRFNTFENYNGEKKSFFILDDNLSEYQKNTLKPQEIDKIKNFIAL